MRGAGEEGVEAVAHSGENEQRQRPFEIVLNHIDDDERQEDHPQQRELVGRGQDLPEVHRYFSPPALPAAVPVALPRNSLTRIRAGSCPVFSAKRWARRRGAPSGRSSSLLSIPWMAQQTAPDGKPQ